MSVRRRIHLRLWAAAALVSLPVAAGSSQVVGGPTVVGSLAAGSDAAARSGGLFGVSMVQLRTADPDEVARSVRATSSQDLSLASPGGLKISRTPKHLNIPRPALIAYQVAAATMAKADPDCSIDWSLLAAIGRVESDHGRYAEARLGGDGVSRPSIRGVALNGVGAVRAVPDTDGGRLDGDTVWDRAVGPMQFLPSTWAYAGVDADGDGRRSPDDLDDAALAAAVYLCAAPGNLDDIDGLRAAVHRYNQSDSYVDLVVRLAEAFRYGDAVDILPAAPTSSYALDATWAGPMMTRAVDTRDQDRSDHDRPSGGPSNLAAGSAEIREPVEPVPGSGNVSPEPDGPATSPDPAPGTEPDPTDPTGPAPDPEPGTEPDPTEPGTEPDPAEPLPDTEPVPEPGTDPEPEPSPTPEPPPAPAPVNVLTYVGGKWYLDELLLDVGDEAWLATTSLADLDGDGVLETNTDELTGLAGQQVDLGVDTSTGTVLSVNGHLYR